MRYGVIITQQTGTDTDPKHYLTRGTLVRVIRETELGACVTETLYPVFGIEKVFLGYRYETRIQYLDRDDFAEFPECLGPMLEAFADLFRKTREFFGV
jgi:hypothetical protein